MTGVRKCENCRGELEYIAGDHVEWVDAGECPVCRFTDGPTSVEWDDPEHDDDARR